MATDVTKRGTTEYDVRLQTLYQNFETELNHASTSNCNLQEHVKWRDRKAVSKS